MALATVQLDGRLARSARSRAAVVDALLDLLQQGDLQPTAARVAARAGVSLRLVFQHFADLEALYAEAADRQTERLRPALSALPASGTFARRLQTFVAHRSRTLETITPIRRAALLRAPFSPVLAARLQHARAAARAQLAAAFQPELNGRPAAVRRELLAALAVATGFSTWEALRRHQGLAVNQARNIMARLVRALLKERT